ncbi:Glycosyltransferase, GT2 family [Pseudomonas flavescens]|uniref:Glycosyltransferase, GT2 family n=1 Tax=Phytopseudomonas flavescens TaxID=29435 RepID=A0A1G8J9K8_9GAMM|nr:glycosyltransferase [Pseudomonas flavescens]SDI27743.1 Glycosyltransferase, GT2 family [Pseudomonas flavescens]
MRELLSKRPQPYYIYAPDYRRSSSGIRVMHMLCDALIRSGHEAYVTASVLSPEFMTPRLTEEVVAAHRSQALEPIVVYPEVVDGNPLNGAVVVRYILNRPGFIEGNGQFAESDILYAYSRDLLMPGINEERVMMLPPFDLNVFRLPDDPAKRVPGKVCYYRGRRRELRIDPALLPPDAVEITPQWPASWEEMADLFQQCEIFYCGGSSALGTEALLCGCLCVVIVEEGAPRIGVAETQSHGAAWGTSAAELQRARQSVHLVRDNWLRLQREFWPALDRFIEVTQTAAEERASERKLGVVRSWLSRRVLTPVQAALIDQRLLEQPPAMLHVLVRTRGATLEQVRTTLDSLHAAGRSARIRPLLLVDGQGDFGELPCERIGVVAGDLVAAINGHIQGGQFDWLLLVDAGAQFVSSGLVQVELSLGDTGSCKAFYTDELHAGEPDLGGVFRPGFNLDLLLSLPSCMARHWLFERQALASLGGFDATLREAYEFDVILRMLEAEGIAAIGHLDEPLAIFASPALNDNPGEMRAIEAHLRRRGYPHAHLLPAPPGRYRIDYGHAEKPLVSIIIPMRDQLPLALRCVTSILERTRYPAYELLIVDNGSQSADTRNWLEGIASLDTNKVRVLSQAYDANLSRLHNLAVEAARGQYLVFLASCMAVLHDDWLDGLLNHAMRPEVAAVGAKQFDSAERIRNAGLLLGLRGAVNSPFVNEPRDASGFMQRLQVDQNYSAVDGACLMISRAVYTELGGMDAQQFAGCFGALDLCLRAGQAGLLMVWTPHVELLYGGSDAPEADYSPADPAFVREQDTVFTTWLAAISRDPAYNANLSLNGSGFQLELDSDLNWRPLSWRPLPVVMAHMGDYTGCGHYRVIKPFQAMEQEALLDGKLSPIMHGLADMGRYAPDSIVMQRQLSEHFHDWIRRIGASTSIFKVYELDDYLPNLPLKSVHRGSFSKDTLRSLRKSLGLVDRFVVSTEPLAEALAGMHADIRVVKNRLPLDWWGALSSVRRQGGKPRVGWAGGSGHTGDLELIVDVVKDLASEVDWIFFGMCPDALRPFIHEFHAGVSIDQYPAKLASLDLDLALAPLEDNLFNRCKSNLRLLEYGICGYPVVCTDIEPYRDGFAVTRVRNRYKEWVDAIRAHVGDLDAAAAMGDRLRGQVLADWMLSGENLKGWRAAWLPD